MRLDGSLFSDTINSWYVLLERKQKTNFTEYGNDILFLIEN